MCLNVNAEHSDGILSSFLFKHRQTYTMTVVDVVVSSTMASFVCFTHCQTNLHGSSYVVKMQTGNAC